VGERHGSPGLSLPCAPSDFVAAAARTPNDETVEIRWSEVFGVANAH
jgi:hypothetical protein